MYTYHNRRNVCTHANDTSNNDLGHGKGGRLNDAAKEDEDVAEQDRVPPAKRHAHDDHHDRHDRRGQRVGRGNHGDDIGAGGVLRRDGVQLLEEKKKKRRR